nr:magnetosome protein MamC [Gammaproteobacteria bacterium]
MNYPAYAVMPYAPTYPHPSSGTPSQSLLRMAAVGAIIGAVGAASVNLRRLQRNEIEGQQALVNTLKVSASSALATAAATVVAGYIGGGPLVSTAVTVATGTGVMYVLNPE